MRDPKTPPWLQVMRAISGTVETPGDEDNPKIMGMADYIGRQWPEMESYCDLYTEDATPWCGLTAAFCVSVAKIRPPFQPQPADDTERFLWAQSWADDPNYMRIAGPVPGCIVVLTREGGGHVTLYERSEGSNYICRGGNQSDAINEKPFAKSTVIALVWPKGVPLPPIPPAERPELEEGSQGAEVAWVQTTLLGASEADGDFGPVTEAAVMGYQAATGLEDDGVVGPDTYAELDDLETKLKNGSAGLTEDVTKEIIKEVERSPLVGFKWDDRGVAPIGYLTGMALSYGVAVVSREAEISAFMTMASAESDREYDALRVYHDHFVKAKMDNSKSGVDTMRHLFVLLIGLGMRESSGNHWEGRDMSASNVSSDTCEAGLFQTSANILTADEDLPTMFDDYWEDPTGFLDEFNRGVSPSPADLDNYGSGQGAQFQWLSKFCPLYAAFTCALAMRSRSNHWGPINRGEVQLVKAVDTLLLRVENIVGAGSDS